MNTNLEDHNRREGEVTSTERMQHFAEVKPFQFFRNGGCFCRAVWLAIVLLPGIFGVFSAGAGTRGDARAAYDKAAGEYKAQPQNSTNAWEFGRACFDLAEFATNKAERAALAEEGIAACRQALSVQSNSAAAHYYLGLNFGQLARTRGLSALRIIKEMEAEWQTAERIDPKFDHGGPERSLGMLYRDAPSFASIGSRSKARQQLTRAVELAPNYPENRFELIETYLQWGDTPAVRRELQALEAVWPAARAEWSGAQWANTWQEWEAHLEKLKQRLGEPAKLETPKH